MSASLTSLSYAPAGAAILGSVRARFIARRSACLPFGLLLESEVNLALWQQDALKGVPLARGPLSISEHHRLSFRCFRWPDAQRFRHDCRDDRLSGRQIIPFELVNHRNHGCWQPDFEGAQTILTAFASLFRFPVLRHICASLSGAGCMPVTSHAVRHAARARSAAQGSSVGMFKTAAVMPAFERHMGSGHRTGTDIR